jgi:hypothetical protein
MLIICEIQRGVYYPDCNDSILVLCVSECGTPAEQLTPQIVDTMFPSNSSYALYGWKKDVFAAIKRKKDECIFV